MSTIKRLMLRAITQCTALDCQHQFNENESPYFVKIVTTLGQGLKSRPAFWGAVLCKTCFTQAHSLFSSCGHDLDPRVQISQVFVNKTDIACNPDFFICHSCFSNIKARIGRLILPWSQFIEVLKLSCDAGRFAVPKQRVN